MSYIRGNSNPEGLYVFDDGEKIRIKGGLPCSVDPDMAIDPEIFRKVAVRWEHEGQDEPVSEKGFRVEEIYTYLEDGSPVGEKVVHEERKRAFLVKLTHGKKKIFLWRVTWEYVVNDVLRRERLKKRAK